MMPTVKDKLGNVIAKMPYDDKGEQVAEKMVQDNPNLDIDYAPGGTTNAPDNRESYQLGGQIPGQPGFGEKPMVNPLPSPGRLPGTAGYVYEEGGEVKAAKKAKRKDVRQTKRAKRVAMKEMRKSMESIDFDKADVSKKEYKKIMKARIEAADKTDVKAAKKRGRKHVKATKKIYKALGGKISVSNAPLSNELHEESQSEDAMRGREYKKGGKVKNRAGLSRRKARKLLKKKGSEERLHKGTVYSQTLDVGGYGAEVKKVKRRKGQKQTLGSVLKKLAMAKSAGK